MTLSKPVADILRLKYAKSIQVSKSVASHKTETYLNTAINIIKSDIESNLINAQMLNILKTEGKAREKEKEKKRGAGGKIED